MHITKIPLQNSTYPDTLREIAAPPKQLFLRGQLPTEAMVAIVGSRRPTEYGRQVTYQIASQLAKAGLVIVSGLAYGVDAIAHQAAVDVGGKAIAVLGSAIDCIGPAGNRQLAYKIMELGGGIISEYPVGYVTQKVSFVARNRIIAGLSQGVIVTEAAAGSGSLITANFGLNQGKIIMAVPGAWKLLG